MLSAGDVKALTHVVAASVRVKADVVAKDERESGLRMILNYGHTLGHAIEAATGYKQLLHGEAVGWGSIAATRLGWMRGMITEQEAERIIALILRYGPLSSFRADGREAGCADGERQEEPQWIAEFCAAEKDRRGRDRSRCDKDEMLAAAEWMLALMRSETAEQSKKPAKKKRG